MFNPELIAFLLYFIVVLAIGLTFFFKTKSGGEKEYFLGGRSMGPWVTAMSAQASDMSGWLLMGFPGSILAFGLGQAWIGIGLTLGTIADCGCFLPPRTIPSPCRSISRTVLLRKARRCASFAPWCSSSFSRYTWRPPL